MVLVLLIASRVVLYQGRRYSYVFVSTYWLYTDIMYRIKTGNRSANTFAVQHIFARIKILTFHALEQ